VTVLPIPLFIAMEVSKSVSVAVITLLHTSVLSAEYPDAGLQVKYLQITLSIQNGRTKQCA
jgi:hypothetical protein